MCIICVDYQKQLLTVDEAWRNLGEMVVSDEHREEVMIMLTENEPDD